MILLTWCSSWRCCMVLWTTSTFLNVRAFCWPNHRTHNKCNSMYNESVKKNSYYFLNIKSVVCILRHFQVCSHVVRCYAVAAQFENCRTKIQEISGIVKDVCRILYYRVKVASVHCNNGKKIFTFVTSLHHGTSHELVNYSLIIKFSESKFV